MTVKRAIMELCKSCGLDILQYIIQNRSCGVSLYENVLQAPCQPKLFTRRVDKGVIYDRLQGDKNCLCFTLGGICGHSAAISHEVMNIGKLSLSVKNGGLKTCNMVAEIGVT